MNGQTLFLSVIAFIYAIYFIVVGVNIIKTKTYISHITSTELIVLFFILLVIPWNNNTIFVGLCALICFLFYLFFTRKKYTKLFIYNIDTNNLKKIFDKTLLTNDLISNSISLYSYEINPITHTYTDIIKIKNCKHINNQKQILLDFENNIYTKNSFEDTYIGKVMIFLGIVFIILIGFFFIKTI